MKKVLSSILISFIVFTNLFAPFSVGFDKKGVEISKSEARAAEATKILMGITSKTTMAGTSLEVEARFNYPVELEKSSLSIAYFITTDTTKTITDNEPVWVETGNDLQDPVQITGGMYQYKFGHAIYKYSNAKGITKNLEDGVTYYVYTAVFQKVNNITTQIGGSDLQSWKGGTLSTTGGAPTPEGQAEAQAAYDARIAKGDTPEQALATVQGAGSETVVESQSIDSGIPACSFNPLSIKGSVMGCVAQGFYYGLFVPTSYLFALSGIFFDNTFAYSVQDMSYRSSFVVEGWGLVRDFCNLFFIFVLLYVAIGTILDLPHFKTKDTIINVVVIGLLINFSLFATQVIIDASNVTARVFYNADTIKIVNGSNTGASDWVAKADENGVIPMSAALVNKINPQNIILQAKQINNIQANGSSNTLDTQSQKTDGIGIGSFITIVILASTVNIIGFIVFLSIGLIFVSRIVGLWVAMILAPLAFFTYIIPSFAKTKMIGWENWWPDTLKLAFLAPVFMFFMYIILKFLELDLIPISTGKNGLAFFLSILMPFAFIIVLLLKAKSIASDMSGEMGKQITGGVATIGGLALGGTALGAAALLRKGVGQTAAKISRGDTATQRYEAGTAKGFQKFTGALGSKFGMGKAYGKVGVDANGNKTIIGGIGEGLNKKQKHVGDINHARHDIEEAKKSAGLEGRDDNTLSLGEESMIEKKFTQGKKAEVETNIKRGIDSKGNDLLITDSLGTHKGEDAYKAAHRLDEINKIKAAKKPEDLDSSDSTGLSSTGKEKLKNNLNSSFNGALKETTEREIKKMFKEIRDESKLHISMIDKGISGINKHSFDVRNLSQLKADKRDGLINRIPTALISGVALGVRAGLKSGAGIDHGKGEGNFIKDLGSTLTEALKSVKIEVPKATSGGGHGGGDAHGGGGGHH